ncbi:MAG: ATP-binding protein [Chitinophagaceae bacterium]
MKNFDRHPEEAILNNMSRLNNELVNSQRDIFKQHAAINRLNQRLMAANTNLEEFSYAASHDLKEPLRMIVGFMKLLKQHYAASLDDKANSYIDLAMDGGQRMQKMISDLLELSRTTHDNTAKEMISLDDLVHQSMKNIITLIEDTKSAIIITTPMPVLLVNDTQLIRLFQNLLSNAIKFRSKKLLPAIAISSVEKQNHWLFGVEDNGIGIPKEKLEKVFEIFRRLHSQEEFEGTGIGLATCKKIVENYGGKIWVDSVEGKGSTFYFTLAKHEAISL